MRWLVVGLLAAGTACSAWAALRAEPTHTTLPIFTPVSLEMERALRGQRNQPAGRGGEEALALAQALADEPLDTTTAAAIAPELAHLEATRIHLLGLRDERHALNTRLMQVGVELGGLLDAAQWDAVLMRRDALRVDGDAAVFDRVLRRVAP